ncbi:DUF5691 domain-containing protein [Streptomyces sp. NPDC005438]|uniref:DUF5691 domain-containing protein n=1 Tax=Streptomyces sp. NPDC005438 TaxID=3156880 RepID=UPI0033B4B5C0
MTGDPTRHRNPTEEGTVTDPGIPWNDLVSAALLGAERRTPPGGGVGALLDAAAVRTVRHRAGLRPAPAPASARPEPAPPDDRPFLPEAAARRLALLLTDRSRGGDHRSRGSSPHLAELLPQWLSLANAYGYQAPPALLPELLDTARARDELRPLVTRFGGPRAAWLARWNHEWGYAQRRHPDELPDGADDPPRPPDAERVRRLWEEGLPVERQRVLDAVRRHDPAAARELLESTWSRERAADRQSFLGGLRAGLSRDDEPFLERALDDRSGYVRALAAELLSLLPDSALARRVAERARACVRPPATPGDSLVVRPPTSCGPEMVRDGVTEEAPPSRGQRGWWLDQLVAATPLPVWEEALARPPEEIVQMPAEEWREDLRSAWCRAAVRQLDVRWARALIGPPTTLPKGQAENPAPLLAVLPARERVEWASRFVAAQGLDHTYPILETCPVPWPAPLGDAVVDALEIARERGAYPWSLTRVVSLAERCLDPDLAPRLAPLGELPETTGNGYPGARTYWVEAAQRLVATLELRRTLRAELAGERHPPGPADPSDGSPGFREEVPHGE